MKKELENLNQKIEDYSRFLVTLIILSIFFYLGMIISVFIEPNGKGGLLAGLTVITLMVAWSFMLLLRRWQYRVNEYMEK